MNKISQRTINILSICAVGACYFGTLLALMNIKTYLAIDLSRVIKTYFFLFVVGLTPSFVVNLMSCFVCKSWPVKKLYFSDIFQLAGYGFGICILLTSVQFTGAVPENLKYYQPFLMGLFNSIIAVILRNVLRENK